MDDFINRKEALKVVKNSFSGEAATDIARAWAGIVDMPAEDVRKVVYCRDCKFWQDAEEGIVEIPICERNDTKYTGLYSGHIFAAGPNDFCSFGVRKEGKEERIKCANIVSVIRCKDCRYCEKKYDPFGRDTYVCQNKRYFIDLDGFCCDGTITSADKS